MIEPDRKPAAVDDGDIAEVWDRLADDWQIQVGDDGDTNRRLNSDPVLRDLLGDVAGLDLLDAGCGTGYLARELAAKGARVVGVDVSPKMIAIAREQAPDIDFRVDTLTGLASVDDAAFDRVVANYVLMDTPDLDAAVRSFHRVLRPGGVAVLVFSHPCFPQGAAHARGEETVEYRWEFSYFDETRRVDPPWAHFRSEFVWFHRPLSQYWQAFAAAGFTVVGLEEPRIGPDRFHLAGNPRKLAKLKSRPYSIAFKLLKA